MYETHNRLTRLRQFFAYAGVPSTEICILLGVSPITLIRWYKSGEFPLSALMQIAEHFPNLSMEYIIRGKGSMLLSDDAREAVIARCENLISELRTIASTLREGQTPSEH